MHPMIRMLGTLITNSVHNVLCVQVEEYFGGYECHCDAWSELGQVSSRPATISIGCKSDMRSMQNRVYDILLSVHITEEKVN